MSENRNRQASENWNSSAVRLITGLMVLAFSCLCGSQVSSSAQTIATDSPSSTSSVDTVPAKSGISSELLLSLQAQNRSQTVPQGPFSVPVVGAEQQTHRVLILKAGMDWNQPESIVWEWHANQSSEIRSEHQKWFGNPDECKPVLGTTHLLMTASGGGVALIRLEDKKVLFYAMAGGNPHSAELLPDGNVVSVSSAGYFTVYAVPETFTTPDVPKKTFPIVGGHGVIWDAQEQWLWVLGYQELAAYRYNFDKAHPDFTKELSIPVKGTAAEGGHDLYWVPGSRALFCTGRGVGIFDLETRQFTTIRAQRSIKSVSLSPEGVLIYQVPTEEWWSDRIPFGNQPLTPMGTLKDAKFYKIRWWMAQ